MEQHNVEARNEFLKMMCETKTSHFSKVLQSMYYVCLTCSKSLAKKGSEAFCNLVEPLMYLVTRLKVLPLPELRE